MSVRAVEALGRAVKNPLVRGGLTFTAGIAAGNVLGFFRVAYMAYLVGTRPAADALAVSIGFLDVLNGILANTIIFAFVPTLEGRSSAQRAGLMRRLARVFLPSFAVLAIGMVMLAPWLVAVLAPGLGAEAEAMAINILRIVSISSAATGAEALFALRLYTQRRFVAPACRQAVFNTFTIAGALLLWDWLGVYSFAAGYALGSWVQFAIVALVAGKIPEAREESDANWRELMVKPSGFLFFESLIAINLLVTRGYAAHAGSGIVAALDYCMRCINVPLAYLVSPVSNSLLPEIARLRHEWKLQQAFHLIDRTAVMVAVTAVAGCAFGLALRLPLIALLFERGNFTPQSTQLVGDVFLGLAPSLIGWSLLELYARSLFALDRPWLAVWAAAIPVIMNLGFALIIPAPSPWQVGLGASLGLFVGFVALRVLARGDRRRMLA